MRRFLPRYEVVFSGGVFYAGGGKVVFPDGRLFNTRYTEETHSKNSAYPTFCRQAKRAAGGAALNRSNIFLCRPTHSARGKFVKSVKQRPAVRENSVQASICQHIPSRRRQGFLLQAA